jgi:hypothetical protein
MRLRQFVDVLSAMKVSQALVVWYIDLHKVRFTGSTPAKMANCF